MLEKSFRSRTWLMKSSCPETVNRAGKSRSAHRGTAHVSLPPLLPFLQRSSCEAHTSACRSHPLPHSPVSYHPDIYYKVNQLHERTSTMTQIRGTAGYNLGSQNRFGGPGRADATNDPSPLDAIREQTSKIEDLLDTYSDPVKP